MEDFGCPAAAIPNYTSVRQLRNGIPWSESCYYMADTGGESCDDVCPRLVPFSKCEEEGMAKITTEETCAQFFTDDRTVPEHIGEGFFGGLTYDLAPQPTPF